MREAGPQLQAKEKPARPFHEEPLAPFGVGLPTARC